MQDPIGYGGSPGDAATALVDAVGKLNLAHHIVELEAFGYTVVPPETVGFRAGLVDDIRAGLVRVHEQRNDVRIGDPAQAELPYEHMSRGDTWWLLESPGVAESLTNPVLLTMARWLVGLSGVLSGAVYLFKSQFAEAAHVPLHTDAHGVPCPTSHIAHAANTSILLTDYDDDDDGPTVVVPGSHRFGRVPIGAEQQFWADPYPYRVVPIRGKAGSVAVWHGNTWHGAMRREKPGLRMTLVHYWARSYMRPINDFRGEVPPELIERHSGLREILGLDHCYPWREGPRDPLEVLRLVGRGSDPFA